MLELPGQERLSPFQIFLLFLSFYVLIAIGAQTFFQLPRELQRLFRYLDYIVCGFFFIDFCLRFKRAESKLGYMKWGWIDLLACIPLMSQFQAARLFRVILIFRLVRALRSIKSLVDVVFRNRAEGVFVTAASATMLLVAFGAIAMLLIEGPVPESQINTAEEALWWAFVTVTTVGYGDYYPVTLGGRLVAVVVMIGGVGMFGSFAAYVGSLFVADENDDADRQHRANREMMRHLNRQIDGLGKEVALLREELAEARASRRSEEGGAEKVAESDAPGRH
ncbi:ion transporter [Larsenimonas salina]|uniref:ion transporter n=1 Tax=Larsenimonas salina TaxID=1295565 RepID=UPI002073795F|nr:ion transporter [Larsenimonas salina]